MNHKKKTSRAKSGLTLIEILLYIGIVSGVLIAASTFAWNIIGSKTKSQVMLEVDANATITLERLTQLIREARDIDSSSLLEANLADSANAGESLTLTMRTASQNPTVIDVDNGILRILRGAGTAVALTSNLVRVSDLTFTNHTLASGKTKNLGITLSIENVNPENRQERAASIILRSAVELRDRSQ